MKKLVRVVVALAVLALGAVIVPPAQAAPSSYTPTGALFNDPNGTRDQQLALMDPIVNSVNSVPAGSIIRFVAYSFSWQPMADALIAAHKRGCKYAYSSTAITTNYSPGTDTPQLKALRGALGTDGRPATSGPANTAVCQTAPRTSTPSSTCSREPETRSMCR